MQLSSLFLLPIYFYSLSHCSVLAISKITPAQWAVLNGSVDGRLYLGRPMAFPCYTSYDGIAKPANTTACAEIESKKTSLSYIGDRFGGFVQGNWGVCQATNKGCPISPTSTTSHHIIEGDCDQGNVPDYYIDVGKISHAEEGFKFANKHGIQVVIKNTGHDYMGRSAAPHTLALWMHNYQPPITLTNQFVPEGCKNPTGNVVTFGAGQEWDGVYRFAEAHNVTVVGGSSATVGAAGGWITGGGHGALSPVFGLGVDNVQQFRVVLPNSTLVTANRCQNTDIFFALRGGGGGTFGAIMEMSTLAHQQVTVQWASFKFFSLNTSQSRQFLQILVSNANRWAAEGWGGYSYPISKGDLEFINPLLNASEAEVSLKPLIDFANSLLEKAEITMATYPSWYQLYAANIAGVLANSGSFGSAISSRLIPSSNFEGTENQDRLVQTFIASSQKTKESNIILMLLMVAPSRTPDDNSSVTPVWRKATWHVIMLTLWDPTKTTSTAINAAFKDVHEAMNPLREITPSGAAYINEADVFEPDDVGSFWGQENYKQLLKIKKEIDPNRVLQVHRGIGWNPKAEIFECYPKSPNTFVRSKDEL